MYKFLDKNEPYSTKDREDSGTVAQFSALSFKVGTIYYALGMAYYFSQNTHLNFVLQPTIISILLVVPEIQHINRQLVE